MLYQVKEVADMTGISIRTLHHYDHIQLLKPASVTESGYRQYSDADLERLQQILFFREIGFRLEEIKKMIDHPEFNREAALRSQKEILLKKKLRLENMIQTVERTMAAIEGREIMSKQDLFAGLSMKDIEDHQKKYTEEARALYGTEIVDQTEKKMAAYTKDEWAMMMSEWNGIYERIAGTMTAGPGDPQAQAAVEDFRNHISKHFYECTLDIFRGLGNLYVSDQRFTDNINKYGPGLAAFLREAIIIYCDNAEK
ncbi:MerR family transcriptional regulator [Bacillus atrophaeus]|uniref:MerR family transcriptional regulator n=1 Tax=Bacillus atrophaeus TaxID=1452 RepID=UPI0022800B06|nr:MerR family transcriptional regulator [Bacillus atrophaeus]MCY7945776.1 MerR family transcriptional regulator [Bacillus atrophaeus]MCY8096070.1 MerR family transcriptional regulator [Bacillus atrophaeus]MCY8463279.1 MerR family transcriptional regulator [Bacillus atrophaeus]MCY8477443.1 MerR family transcriptional regulator [Bacillus atrophaeus]MCY8497934.1 MerR family transcriptional regulator [Bacillus atrophaeus]